MNQKFAHDMNRLMAALCQFDLFTHYYIILFVSHLIDALIHSDVSLVKARTHRTRFCFEKHEKRAVEWGKLERSRRVFFKG